MHGRQHLRLLTLNELEAAGRVERRRDPADRRRHLVAITEAGRTALDGAERAQATIEDEVLAALGAEERATLRRLLRRALEGAASEAVEPLAGASV